MRIVFGCSTFRNFTDSLTCCQTVGSFAYKFSNPVENFWVLKLVRRHFSMDKVDLLGMVDMVDMVENMDMVDNMNMVDSFE
jgi:hypothetical protein